MARSRGPQALTLAALLLARTAALSCAPTTLGCFDDSRGPHVVGVAILAGSSATMTPGLCALGCALSGQSLAGLTGHTSPTAAGYCYCGVARDPRAVPAPAANCSMPCPGGGGTCGANEFMQLLNFTCDFVPPPPVGPPLGNGTACSHAETRGLPFCNTSLTYAERTRDLVGRIPVGLVGPQLTARNAPAIPHLGSPAYYWGTNCACACAGRTAVGRKGVAGLPLRCPRGFHRNALLFNAPAPSEPTRPSAAQSCTA